MVVTIKILRPKLLSTHCTEDELNLIIKACIIDNRTVSSFIRNVVIKQAEYIIKENEGL